MTFGESIKTCFKKYATFSGRASRSEFWWFSLFLVLVEIALDLFVGPDPDYNSFFASSPVGLVWSLATFLPSIAVSVRRLHDVDKSGAFMFIPIYNLVLWASAGTRGPNEYGPDPLNPESQFDFDRVDGN